MKKDREAQEKTIEANERERLFRIALAEKLAKSLPSFKTRLSPKQKRELIREHVGDVGRFDYFLNFKLDEHDIYSITCSILAKKYDLNASRKNE